MENCFRFLINVDQCLNMSAYDIFFYKMASQHKFRSHNVQLFGSAPGSTLRDAVRGIRTYLDRYPYHVEDYQIIVAMRSFWDPSANSWEQTVLYRLLRLSRQLRDERIFINSRESGEKALNLVMLYDADFSVDLPELGNYLSNERFQADCRRMLALAGIGAGEESPEAVNAALDIYEAQEGHDAEVAGCLRRYVRAMGQSISFVQQQALSDEERNGLFSGFSGFVREELANFQVLESFIDRNNRRQNMLSILRLVEFINMPLPKPQDGTVIPLAQRCLRNWETVWADRELESRYAKRLRQYRTRLTQAALEMERPKFQTEASGVLPAKSEPGEKDISASTSATNQTEYTTSDLIEVLDNFLRVRFTHGGAQRWEQAHESLQTTLSEMEYQLGVYATDLSRQYAAVLDQRKADTTPWRTGSFVADRDLEKDIHELEHAQDTMFRQLQTRHIAPDIHYADEVNIENALEQTNATVRFNMQCIRYITAGGFLLLILACLGAVALHYTVLQTYVFQSLEAVGWYGCCLLAIFLSMLMVWGLPYSYFRDRTRQSVKQLKDAINRYVPQYSQKKENFREYVNLLNRLDYITRYHRLLTRTANATRRLSKGYLWHKVQLEEHLKKVQHFQGLIDTVPQEDEGTFDAAVQLPTVRGGSVQDVVDSPVYWP